MFIIKNDPVEGFPSETFHALKMIFQVLSFGICIFEYLNVKIPLSYLSVKAIKYFMSYET